jgi:uncharacterized protein YvpB
VVRFVAAALPTDTVIFRGSARITLRLDVPATARAIESRRLAGGSVAAVRHPVESLIAAPFIAQRLQNDCEATSLSVILATTGVHASQQQLQSEIARSGPLDPRRSATGEIWGDPDQGFVGRPEGGGSAGGFGVYPRPVAALAARHGRHLSNLTGAPTGAIYTALLAGRAVMAWVALSQGPYRSWTSPQGKAIRVNFGEHTVTLVGLNGDGLLVDNPLSGRLEHWSRSTFQTMWDGLGRRALAA